MKMKLTGLIIVLILFCNSSNFAQWEKVHGTNVNNTIVYQIVKHNGSLFASTNGSLLKSTDQGATWNSVNVGGIGVVSVASDGSRLFAGLVLSMSGSTLLYSNDDGQTWINTNITQSQISNFGIVNHNLMFAYTNFQKTYKSTDRGESWTEMTGLPFTVAKPIFVSSSGRIFMNNHYSDDNGESWTQMTLGASNNFSESGSSLWVARSGLYVSNDNGINWQKKSNLYSYSVLVQGNFILKGTYGFSYSTDNGENFTEYNAGINNVDNVLSMVIDGEYIIIGLDGPGIFRIKASDLGIATSVEEPVMTAADFQLHQNYPNPFNPSTVISYQLPESGLVSLKIYDVIGNEVADLINNELRDAGTHSHSFSSANYSFPSGVYFYRLQVNGVSQVRKMTLLK